MKDPTTDATTGNKAEDTLHYISYVMRYDMKEKDKLKEIQRVLDIYMRRGKS